MVLVRRIRKRGANIVVEANGEVLFMPQGDVGRWQNRFSQRVRAATIQEAPTNVRPRWGHYGKPLKATFTASTVAQPGRMKVYSAIGSSAPHAAYVDQGTGVYGGSGPYQAKVLPPWSRGDSSLYESTWRPGGPSHAKVAPVMIKGQRGQFFFDTGLKRGFQSMRMRSFQVPGEGQISQAMASLPSQLLGFLGNTPSSPGFRASLREWRAWRDESFRKGESLNRSRYNSAAALKKAQARRRRERDALPENVKKYLASRAASDQRKKDAEDRARQAKEAKTLAKQQRAEREAAADLNYRMNSARAKGVAFGKRLISDGGVTNVSARWVRGSDGQFTSYAVTWTSVSGKSHSERFPL